MSCRDFNVRVYGLLFNSRGEVLVTDEDRFGRQFTKFPGGGLEKGEGIVDCLYREFREELEIDIESHEHFYTTDFFQPSAFDASQVISIYYKVRYPDWLGIEVVGQRYGFNGKEQVFRWIKLEELSEDDLTFPIDRHVATMI